MLSELPLYSIIRSARLALQPNLLFTAFQFFLMLKAGGLVFLDHFDVLMLKIIFKKIKKNIILIHFGTKSTFKSYRNRPPKQARTLARNNVVHTVILRTYNDRSLVFSENLKIFF